MSAAALDLQGVMDGLTRLATSVQSAPISQAQLRERWGNPDERTFQRWLKDLRLVPFQGRGESAMYRMASVLRAEEWGEKRNGGVA